MLFDNVVAACEKKGITIARLEREAGLGNATVRGWKKSIPNIATIQKVAAVLDTSIGELLDGSGTAGDTK